MIKVGDCYIPRDRLKNIAYLRRSEKDKKVSVAFSDSNLSEKFQSLSCNGVSDEELENLLKEIDEGSKV
ncbi:hypothetical protein Thena_0405 [Thermodesulfobium narugense DSM 14796]|uniref:Uncharacterized protein n=1 Tax=Thermodesulfobium narugense DSM 14796 TaxID=747365 RepID=M1E7L5_9BACT|nr:hypothetical protein [Thermodesulfobium narugense]AEE14049.1 hypothetical protein Thena_0405 [Thermodesulfobium narugense DSM 14796]